MIADGFHEMRASSSGETRSLKDNTTTWKNKWPHTTELVAMNAQLVEAKERAEEASCIKSEFLANISREIRAPMNGVVGMTELALEIEQREYLELVTTSADSLLSIINDVLDFSKVEAGTLQVDRVDFDLRDTLEDVLKAFGVRAAQRGLELACGQRRCGGSGGG